MGEGLTEESETMAMDPNVLGPKLAEPFAALGEAIRNNQPPPPTAELWRMFAAAIIEHIQQHAEITPDGTPPLEAGGDPVTGKAKIA